MLHSYQIKFMINEKKYTYKALLPDYFKKLLKLKDLIFQIWNKIFQLTYFLNHHNFDLKFFKLVTPLSLIPHGIIFLYFFKSLLIFIEKPW